MAAVWGQVEYRTKQLMPWVEMINGPAKAENSLLLNYITPWTMTSLVASLKRGHFSVSVGILGTMLLQLLTISSTALLSVEYRSIQRQVDTMILDKFDFQGQIDKTDTLVASNYWAMIHYQVPLPHGTTADFATQSFRILPSKSIISRSKILLLTDLSNERDGICQRRRFLCRAPAMRATQMEICRSYPNPECDRQ